MHYNMSEFRYQRARARIAKFKLAASLVFLVAAFVAVSAWDQQALEALKQESLKRLAENTTYRDYLVNDKHCPAPVKDEHLMMELAEPSDPGKGYRCMYWTNVGYGRAARLKTAFYSRGYKS